MATSNAKPLLHDSLQYHSITQPAVLIQLTHKMMMSYIGLITWNQLLPALTLGKQFSPYLLYLLANCKLIWSGHSKRRKIKGYTCWTEC